MSNIPLLTKNSNQITTTINPLHFMNIEQLTDPNEYIKLIFCDNVVYYLRKSDLSRFTKIFTLGSDQNTYLINRSSQNFITYIAPMLLNDISSINVYDKTSLRIFISEGQFYGLVLNATEKSCISRFSGLSRDVQLAIDYLKNKRKSNGQLKKTTNKVYQQWVIGLKRFVNTYNPNNQSLITDIPTYILNENITSLIDLNFKYNNIICDSIEYLLSFTQICVEYENSIIEFNLSINLDKIIDGLSSQNPLKFLESINSV